tara:strand:- start:50 stop:190 length:141 start_codon:yes stop_codon:yes gene_type:complete
MENLTKKQIEAIRKIKPYYNSMPIEELNSMIEASNKFGYMRVIGFQ